MIGSKSDYTAWQRGYRMMKNSAVRAAVKAGLEVQMRQLYQSMLRRRIRRRGTLRFSAWVCLENDEKRKRQMLSWTDHYTEWEIDGELLAVQGCLERVVDHLPFHRCEIMSSGSSARKDYWCLRFDDVVGRIALTALPKGRTQLEAHQVHDASDDELLVKYLLENVPPDGFSQTLRDLLAAFSWQIEQGVFPEVYKMFYTIPPRDKPEFGWARFGLEDPTVRMQARKEFDEWRLKAPDWRADALQEILDSIRWEMRYVGLRILNSNDEETFQVPTQRVAQPWELIPDRLPDREIIRLWCSNYTSSEIAPQVHLSAGTVTNRISELRRRYPEAHIPTDAKRRKLVIKS